MAVLAGCIVFTKPHGFAMLPGCAFACAWVVAKNLRARRAWIFAAVTAACASVFLLGALVHMQRTGQTALLASPSGAAAAAVRPGTSPSYLSFLDGLTENYELYLIRSFFGQFGWLEYSLPGNWFLGLGFGQRWLDRLIKSRRRGAGSHSSQVRRSRRVAPGWSWLSIEGFLFSGCTALFIDRIHPLRRISIPLARPVRRHPGTKHAVRPAGARHRRRGQLRRPGAGALSHPERRGPRRPRRRRCTSARSSSSSGTTMEPERLQRAGTAVGWLGARRPAVGGAASSLAGASPAGKRPDASWFRSPRASTASVSSRRPRSSIHGPASTSFCSSLESSPSWAG